MCAGAVIYKARHVLCWVWAGPSIVWVGHGLAKHGVVPTLAWPSMVWGGHGHVWAWADNWLAFTGLSTLWVVHGVVWE